MKAGAALDAERGEQTIRAISTEYGGLTWVKRPEVEEAVRRRAGHTQAWKRSRVAVCAVWPSMFVLWVALKFTDIPSPSQLLLLWVPLGICAALTALHHWRWESQVPKNPAER